VSTIKNGSASVSGAISRAVSIVKGGSVTASSAIAKAQASFKALAGSLTAVGTLKRAAAKILTSTIVPFGSIARGISKLAGGFVSLFSTVQTFLQAPFSTGEVDVFDLSAMRLVLSEADRRLNVYTNSASPLDAADYAVFTLNIYDQHAATAH
jgi:hypothetical protein